MTATLLEEDSGERFIEFDYSPLLAIEKPDGFPVKLLPGDKLELSIEVTQDLGTPEDALPETLTHARETFVPSVDGLPEGMLRTCPPP